MHATAKAESKDNAGSKPKAKVKAKVAAKTNAKGPGRKKVLLPEGWTCLACYNLHRKVSQSVRHTCDRARQLKRKQPVEENKEEKKEEKEKAGSDEDSSSSTSEQ